MKKENIEYYATGLFIEFAEFVINHFSHVSTTEEFIEVFGTLFDLYKSGPVKEKIDIVTLERERKISCVGGALVMGFWYLIYKNEEPFFHIEDLNLNGRLRPDDIGKTKKKRKAHVIIEIDGVMYELWTTKKDPGGNVGVLFRVLPDETDERVTSIKINKALGDFGTIDTLSKFLANRLSMFGLNNEARGRISNRTPSIHKLVNRYQDLLSFVMSLANEDEN